MSRLGHVGGVFAELHQALVGVDIDFASLAHGWSPERRQHAIAVWADRVQTEYRSIQVMTRFLTEVLGAGDPLEIYAGVVEAIGDEVRHTALCAGVVEGLGGEALLPDPVAEEENPGFLKLSMAERALGTAVSMLAVSETISTAFIEDLRSRCEQPVIKAVLDATIEDEEGHEAFGWGYVEASLQRFDASARDFARMVVEVTLRPHQERAQQAFSRMAPAERKLEAWPEPELVELGISSPERQALVFERVFEAKLVPRLRRLGIL